MKKLIFKHLVIASLLISSTAIAAEKVNVDNFVRAETDQTIKRYQKFGAFGKFFHLRQPTAIDKQNVIRMNRDTLYSIGIFDLDASPVTIIKPKTENYRFQSMQVISQDHYAYTEHGAGEFTLTQKDIGTRYAIVLIRTFIDANSTEDIKIAHIAQNQISFKQNDTGKLVLPEWDVASLNAMRTSVLGVGKYLPNANKAFGLKPEVDPVRHFLATAFGWGGNPTKDALYDNVTPAKNDGKTAYQLTVKDVPVNGFWSVTVYNSKGFMEKNEQNSYAFNNVTAEKNSDGSVTIHFGGDKNSKNYLPIMEGWNYIARMYQPSEALLNGSYQFPQATILH